MEEIFDLLFEKLVLRLGHFGISVKMVFPTPRHSVEFRFDMEYPRSAPFRERRRVSQLVVIDEREVIMRQYVTAERLAQELALLWSREVLLGFSEAIANQK